MNVYNLTDEQINKLSTKRLLNIYRIMRKAVSTFFSEPERNDYDEKEYDRLVDYKFKLKSILDKRENI